MSEENSHKEKPKGRGPILKSFLGGSILASEKALSQIPFVLFVVFLFILIIANRYWSEKTLTEMEAVQDSIKELRASSVTFETELMRMNRPSEIANRVRESGLELIEPQEPARKLKVDKLNQ
ncbi:FtsL-like putative cell division protein [Mangrovibacterium sp.]|uniref:FtsL-like putative cell division protein n=1 Tax=Mangrovibacterium sp. TaxID=1961364 RepID=UPI0035699327